MHLSTKSARAIFKGFHIVASGFVGRLCDASKSSIELGEEVSGALLPDQSIYFEWILNLQQLLELPAIVELHVTIEGSGDVHPLLCANQNALPSVTTCPYQFLKHYGAPGETLHKIHTSILHKGNLTLGLFNIDLFVHNTFR